MNIKSGKIFVIKIGSSVLLTHRKKLDGLRISHIANQAASLRKAGIGIVLVVSGAVACGSRNILLSEGARISKQAVAGIGQVALTSFFNKVFSKSRFQIAQVLLTKNDLCSKNKRRRIASILRFYIHAGIIPFINENDVVDLNSFGGNDYLAAEIAMLLDADQVIILSTMEGSGYGVGGGTAKQQVINTLNKRNIKGTILNGREKNVLLEAL